MYNKILIDFANSIFLNYSLFSWIINTFWNDHRMQIYDTGIMITVIMSIKGMYSAFLDEQYFVTVKEQSRGEHVH